MDSLTVDSSTSIGGLLAGQHLVHRGMEWASQLVEAASSTVGLRSEVRANPRRSVDAWSVELHVAGQRLIRIDVDTDGARQRSLDRLELNAARTWRKATRDSTESEPRPWLAAIRIAHDREPDRSGVERLTQLVAGRVLDAACVAIVEEDDARVRSPNPAMSVEAFQAAVLGRCLYLATLHPS